MKTVNFFEYEHKDDILEQLENAENLWQAIPYLTGLLKEGTFNEKLGNGALYLMLDEESSSKNRLPRIASFVTFCDKDEIDAPALKPWIGFLFTFPEYRGKRLAGRLIEHCISQVSARYPDAEQIFVSSEENGLYEKYGFNFLFKAKTLYGGETKVYARKISAAPNPLVEIIKQQTEILFKNIDDQISGADLSSQLDNVNNSRYLFHMIHSMDRYFINPFVYSYNAEQAGGIDENYSIISESREGFIPDDSFVVPRETLAAYFEYVKQKIRLYLDSLTDADLAQKPENCPHTKLALILGQYRHSMFHAALSESVTFENSGIWLPYTGFKYVRPS